MKNEYEACIVYNYGYNPPENPYCCIDFAEIGYKDPSNSNKWVTLERRGDGHQQFQSHSDPTRDADWVIVDLTTYTSVVTLPPSLKRIKRPLQIRVKYKSCTTPIYSDCKLIEQAPIGMLIAILSILAII